MGRENDDSPDKLCQIGVLSDIISTSLCCLDFLLISKQIYRLTSQVKQEPLEEGVEGTKLRNLIAAPGEYILS